MKVDCGEVRKNLPLYVDGALEEERALEIEKHLLDCNDCMAEMGKYIRIREAMSEFEDLPLPVGYEERLKERMDNEAKARPKFAKYIAIAAAVAVIFSGIYLTDSGNLNNKQIAESVESETNMTPAEGHPASVKPEMKTVAPQYAENKEESGNKNKNTEANIQSTMPSTEKTESVQQKDVSPDKGIVSENANEADETDKTEMPDGITNIPQIKYGIASKKIVPPVNNEASAEEIVKRYSAVILQTSEESNYTVITVRVDKDKEEQLISELQPISEKIEKDSEGNLKIYLRGDYSE